MILSRRQLALNSTPYSRNIPLFIAFRVLFNARWYYPVLAVLFLDLGLSVEQYALLNVAWAAAIVGLEVPSGAVADRFGRRRMVIIAAALMVIEMLVFAFAPRGNPTLLFAFFLLNRVLSGAAEAAASGADEALAYDSLPLTDREEAWPRVLARVMRWQSVAFFVSMLLGAAAYDATFVQRVLDFLHLPWSVTPQITAAFPIYLTLGNALLALFVAWNLREPALQTASASSPDPASVPHPPAPRTNIWSATLGAGRWILATPAVLAIIAIGFCFDSVTRVFFSVASNYYRLIQLPDATFGLIGSGFAILGFITPSLARRMVDRWPLRVNFTLVATLIFVGFLGCAFIWPLYGLVWMIPIGMAMSFTQFFVSHYLNALVTDSTKRATILSFRGLAYNLAYGAAGLLFAALTHHLTGRIPPGTPDTANLVFTQALGWLPWYFLITVALLVLAVRRGARRADV